ncbi:MAG: DNA/RNA nuclease SfsA [Ruminococcaceae bacterium]|nr:DNA/RNA nuclease SfsA [Oscillospiraceae bacterium]
MRYASVIKGRFLARPNRFLARVDIDGKEETVHVKNTGRCGELLLPGSVVWLSDSGNAARKTRYDLIAVEKQTERGSLLVNIDSQAPNEAAAEWLLSSGLFSQKASARREVQKGSSRFDLAVDDGGSISYIEVKGVTLERDGVALFPDAPTERGVKHVKELIECVKEGFGAYLLFVVQMKGVHTFSPNDETHKAFADVLREAKASGVMILAYDCLVTPDSMALDAPVPLSL